mmetsp:Transcript_27494/g.38690  ORF Transcript_27494/g.38690 Transcript_27494/m.38690 type:complete len:186 (+) Transcript_27494:493-1050(+)
MYLILNTDVSPTWGWNSCNPQDPCLKENPGICSDKGELLCTDCSDPYCVTCKDQVWMKDFCQDIIPSNPAQYKIDYVRVYQDADDPTHTIGCDPPGLETSSIIQENWELYTFDPNVNKQGPLKDIPHGGGDCEGTKEKNIFEEACGGLTRGDCVEGRCRCSTNEWTGPFCVTPFVGQYTTGKPLQ